MTLCRTFKKFGIFTNNGIIIGINFMFSKTYLCQKGSGKMGKKTKFYLVNDKQMKENSVYSAVTAEVSLSNGEIPLSTWNYKIPNFSWLRHYATNRKVDRLIPDKVIGFFN
jgi:hypothetical protein